MRVIWTPQALIDHHRIWLFHADLNVALADRVESRLLRRCDTLGPLPYQGRARPGDYRELSIPDIQLTVVYRIDEDAVRILRIWSTRQDRSIP